MTQKTLADMRTSYEVAEWLCAYHDALKFPQKWTSRDWFGNFCDHIPIEVNVEDQKLSTESPLDGSGSKDRHQTPSAASAEPPDR